MGKIVLGRLPTSPPFVFFVLMGPPRTSLLSSVWRLRDPYDGAQQRPEGRSAIGGIVAAREEATLRSPRRIVRRMVSDVIATASSSTRSRRETSRRLSSVGAARRPMKTSLLDSFPLWAICAATFVLMIACAEL